MSHDVILTARLKSDQSVLSTEARGIDAVIPMRALETHKGKKDRRDCVKQFRAAWERFAGDEANLVEFLNVKRKRR